MNFKIQIKWGKFQSTGVRDTKNSHLILFLDKKKYKFYDINGLEEHILTST